MTDKWVAECLPCFWDEAHDTQDEAIAASEEHVFEYHHTIPSHERAQRKMGHVQLRTVGDDHISGTPSADAPEADSVPRPNDTSAESASAELPEANTPLKESAPIKKNSQGLGE
jgi:hypothetical protein